MLTVDWELVWPTSGQLIISCHRLHAFKTVSILSLSGVMPAKLPHQSIKTTLKSVFKLYSTSFQIWISMRLQTLESLRSTRAGAEDCGIIWNNMGATPTLPSLVFSFCCRCRKWTQCLFLRPSPFFPKNNTNWSNAFLFGNEIFAYRCSTSSLNISDETKPNISWHVHVDQRTRDQRNDVTKLTFSRDKWINGL